MRNDLLTAAGVLLALLVGYWFFHSPMGQSALAKFGHSPLAGGTASAMMREDITTAAGRIKTSLAEFYANRGRMPADNAEAGLPPPAAFRGQTLRSAIVRADGSFELEFDAGSGHDGGVVRMVADTSRVDAMGVQWACQTSDYPAIARAIPTCTYTGQ